MVLPCNEKAGGWTVILPAPQISPEPDGRHDRTIGEGARTG